MSDTQYNIRNVTDVVDIITSSISDEYDRLVYYHLLMDYINESINELVYEHADRIMEDFDNETRCI